MVNVTFSEGFEREFRKLKDSKVKDKIKKQMAKIIENPEAGKPLKYDLKGERTLYIKPYRLIYAFENDKIVLLRFLHREEVYK